MDEPKRMTVFGDEGPNNTTICRILTGGRTLRLLSDRYRLVCGTPRKFWPWSRGEGGAAVFHEAFEYELVAELQMAGKTASEIRDAIAKTIYMEVLQIEGYFEADGCYWLEGAEATFKEPQGEGTFKQSLPDWQFRMYYGDELERLR